MAGGAETEPIRRRLSSRFQLSLVAEAGLAGLAAGLLVAAYRFLVARAEEALRALLAICSENPCYIALWFGVLVLVAGFVAALVRLVPESSGSGIPQIDAEVMGSMDAPWPRVAAAKLAEGAAGALAGLSLGREGPSVQLGGMAAKGVSRAFGRGRGEERLLVTCGAAAGMAAAFHAPLTGVMFALEEIHKTMSATLIVAVMVCAVAADYVSSQLLGMTPVISITLAKVLPLGGYAVVLGFGVFMGVAGALHNAGMFAAKAWLGRLRAADPFARYLVAFVLSGVVALVAPVLLCGGDAIVKLLMRPQDLALTSVLALLVGKYVFTGVCFGSGAPGGTMFPLVVMGGLAGALFGGVAVAALGWDRVLIINFVVLGIAGMFSAVVRAPVTAVVLAFELTGSIDALLSLCVVSIAAFVTANLLGVDAYYERLVAELLGTSVEEAHERWGSEGRQLHSYVIETGCAAANLTLAELDLPARTLVVSLRRHGQERVPHGNTRLLEGDRILVLLDEREGEDSEARVRALCHGSFVPPDA